MAQGVRARGLLGQGKSVSRRWQRKCLGAVQIASSPPSRTGDRELFVVVVGRRDLPGRLRIRSRDGRTLKTLEFGTIAQLCHGSAKGSPLEAAYSF
jgi:hypothetical protein